MKRSPTKGKQAYLVAGARSFCSPSPSIGAGATVIIQRSCVFQGARARAGEPRLDRGPWRAAIRPSSIGGPPDRMGQPMAGALSPSGALSQAHLAFDAHPLGHQRHASPGVGHTVDDHEAVETHTHPAINAPGRARRRSGASAGPPRRSAPRRPFRRRRPAPGDRRGAL